MIALILPGAAAHAGPVAIAGGGGVSSAGGITASLSLGQPIVGTAGTPPITARLGFWHLTGCAADFNNSGGTPTVQDIFDYLAAYFAQDPRADFNGAGGITVQDIFDFLAAYFTPCS